MAELDTERIRAYRHFGLIPPEPSIFQRVTNLLKVSEPELLTLLRENFPLIVDLSHWTGNVDATLLKGKVDGIITKACEYDDGDVPVYDDQFAHNIQGAYDIDVAAGLYIFGNPQIHGMSMNLEAYKATPAAQDREIKMMEYAAKNKTFNIWGIDEERWWIDYNQYWQYQQGKITLDQVKKIGPAWLNTHFRELTNRTQKIFPTKTTICYSGKWFVDGYMRDATNNPYDWTLKFPWWGASYTTTGKKLLWDAIKTIYPPDTAKPPDFNSVTPIWQFGYASLPVEIVNGVTRYASVDLNVWVGGLGYPPSRQGFYDWCGFVPKGDLPPTPPNPDQPPSDLTALTNLVNDHGKMIEELQDFRAKVKAA